jgi:DNA adenine methylase
MLSPIKWTGSKRHFAKELAEKFPQNIKNVYVPFCGGCGVFPYLSQYKIFASDICEPLISTWNTLYKAPDYLLNVYSRYYNKFQNDLNFYYEIRNCFNNYQYYQDDFEWSADFFFLLRTCYIGLIRFNKQGKFNVAVNRKRKGMHPQKVEKLIKDWIQAVDKIQFECEDYKNTFERSNAGDWVFCDPPYEKTKGQYLAGAENFNFAELFNQLKTLNERKVKWMLCLDEGFQNTADIPYMNYFDTENKVSSLARLKAKHKLSGNRIFINY